MVISTSLTVPGIGVGSCSVCTRVLRVSVSESGYYAGSLNARGLTDWRVSRSVVRELVDICVLGVSLSDRMGRSEGKTGSEKVGCGNI